MVRKGRASLVGVEGGFAEEGRGERKAGEGASVGCRRGVCGAVEWGVNVGVKIGVGGSKTEK